MDSARIFASQSGKFRQGTSELSSAVNTAVAGIKANLERARDLVRDAVAELLASFGNLRAVLETQQVALNGITATMGNNGSANFTSVASRLVNEFVDEVIRVSHESMRIIEQLLSTSEHVNAIVVRAERIDSLARETRFIALNARIETQRAGDAGRTFKVVADEVKRLAGASAELSTQIRKEVDECHKALGVTQRTAEKLASHDMSSAIESRSSLLSTIEQLDQLNHTVESALKHVGVSVSDAIRALQFEDMVSQLLNDSIRRVQSLGSLCLEAVAASDPQQRLPSADMVRVTQALRDLGKEGSVTQASMAQGAVELF